MFIRQTKTRSTKEGNSYFTHRLVESKRVGDQVRQRTLLNLGAHFDLPKELWPELCSRIEQILDGEQSLFAIDPQIEQSAQDIYAQIMARRGKADAQNSSEKPEQNQAFEEVDINSLQQIKPRSVGAEHVALEALKQLQTATFRRGDLISKLKK